MDRKTAVFSKDEILCSHPGSALLSRHVPIIAGEQARRVELQRVDPKRGFCFRCKHLLGKNILMMSLNAAITLLQARVIGTMTVEDCLQYINGEKDPCTLGLASITKEESDAGIPMNSWF
ncbi:unnamed protein product [Natator depressus]